MKYSVRNRAAALGIATVAGLAGLGLASGQAVAADASAADSSSQSADSSADTQSVYYPTEPVKYADELVFDAVAIGDFWSKEFGRSGTFIPYGGEESYEKRKEPEGIMEQGHLA